MPQLFKFQGTLLKQHISQLTLLSKGTIQIDKKKKKAKHTRSSAQEGLLQILASTN